MLVTSRSAIAGLALALAAILVAACSSGSQSSSSSGTSSQPLSIFATEPSTGLDPATATTTNSWRVMELIYDTLIDYNSKDQLVPDLAKSWSLSSDGLTYTFHLRANAKFSDGSSITADDVQFSLQRMRTSATMKNQFSMVKSIGVVDPHTVSVTLSAPSRIFLDSLADVGTAAILSKKAVDGNSHYFSKPVATSGPWKLQSYVPKDQMTLKANPYYWNTGYPKIKTINYTFCADPTSCDAALESGTADMYFPMDGQSATRLKDEGKIQVFAISQPNIIIWQMDKTKPPFSDVRVRQAMAYLMPRADAAKTCWGGYNTPSDGEIIQKGSWAYSPGHDPYDLPAAQALKKAESLLESAGWKMGPGGVRVSQGVSGLPNGTKFTVKTVMTSDYAQGVCDVQLLKSDLAPLGIDIIPQSVDSATYVSTLGKSTQMAFGDVGFGDMDDLMYQDFATKGPLNPYFCQLHNATIDSDIAQAQATANLNKAVALYGKVQQILVDNVPCIITGHQISIVGAAVNLKGYYPRADQSNRSLIYATLSE